MGKVGEQQYYLWVKAQIDLVRLLSRQRSRKHPSFFIRNNRVLPGTQLYNFAFEFFISYSHPDILFESRTISTSRYTITLHVVKREEMLPIKICD